ncbi:MAG: heavy-metal-associated domain-containing protein [Planctomycetes bacterium]|nr:heavy-metal-associated domain-containing protein [Planctomycetota bacterium]
MTKFLGALLVVFALATLWSAQAQGPAKSPAYTVITVEKMHCDGCAKRIANKLYEVDGVEKIQVDVEKKLLWVHPQAGKQLSPRGLWEAVEKSNDRPIQLQGPRGTFTKKPQS